MLTFSLPFVWLPLWRIKFRPIIIGILRVTNLIYIVAGHTPYQVGLCSFRIYSYSTVANAVADDTLSQGLFVQRSAQMGKI